MSLHKKNYKLIINMHLEPQVFLKKTKIKSHCVVLTLDYIIAFLS